MVRSGGRRGWRLLPRGCESPRAHVPRYDSGSRELVRAYFPCRKGRHSRNGGTAITQVSQLWCTSHLCAKGCSRLASPLSRARCDARACRAAGAHQGAHRLGVRLRSPSLSLPPPKLGWRAAWPVVIPTASHEQRMHQVHGGPHHGTFSALHLLALASDDRSPMLLQARRFSPFRLAAAKFYHTAPPPLQPVYSGPHHAR